MRFRPSILKVLAYFDLFDYPVLLGEILFFLDVEAGEAEVRAELDALTGEKCLYRTGNFYSLQDKPALVERRIKGNRKADELLPVAAKVSRWLYQFPYVRGIGISGSLSKHFADENADIDYFIITRSNRLWIARTMMHFLKKLSYLRGRQHWFCMNYYVDEDALEIKEKNIFTATEMITLVPASGNGGLVKFFDANDWTTAYFPHYKDRRRYADGPSRPSFLKRILERLFDNRMGDRLDDLLQKMTSRRWKKKEDRGDVNEKGHRICLQNDKHFSRPNPKIFQKTILAAYTQKLKEMETKWQVRGQLHVELTPSCES